MGAADPVGALFERLQAAEDLHAYVGTLDAAETVGELAHVAAMWRGVNGHPASERAGKFYASALTLLTERLVELGTPATVPGDVHSCTFIARAMGAPQ